MSALVSPAKEVEIVSDRDHTVATIRDVNSRLKRLLEVYDDALFARLGSKGSFSHSRPPDPLSVLSQYLPTFIKLSAQVQRYSKLLVDLESDRHKQEKAVSKALAEANEAKNSGFDTQSAASSEHQAKNSPVDTHKATPVSTSSAAIADPKAKNRDFDTHKAPPTLPPVRSGDMNKLAQLLADDSDPFFSGGSVIPTAK